MHRLPTRAILDGAFTLRPLHMGDAESWLAIVSDPRVYEPTSWAVRTLAEMTPGLSRHVESGRRWAVIRAADGAFVGTCGAGSWDDATGEAEVAYELAPEVWGRGLASAAVRAFVEEAGAAGITRIHAHTWVANVASERVLARCGFAREARLPAFRDCRGEWRDYWHWSVGTQGR